jgi:transcriptional regulator with XRE-family HTH domain
VYICCMDIQYIRELRIKYGIKAHEVAKAIGMDRGNYSAWENGLKEYKRKGPDYIITAVSYLRSRAEVMRRSLLEV